VEISEARGTGPGEILRDARREQGISSREMASRLNWMPSHLDAVEENRFEVLRGRTFVRGYLRTYARVLGVPESEVLVALEAMSIETDAPAENDRRDGREPPWKDPTVGIATGVALAILLALAFWLWQDDGDDTGFAAPAHTSVGRPPAPSRTASEGASVSAAANRAGESVAMPESSAPLAPRTAAEGASVSAAVNSAGESVAMPEDSAPLASRTAGAGASVAAADGAGEFAAVPEDSVPAAPRTAREDAGAFVAAADGAGGFAAVPASPAPVEAGIEPVAPAADETGSPADESVPGALSPLEPPAEGAVRTGVLEFSFSGDCWLEVRDAAELIYFDLHGEGDELRLEGAAPFSILVGDARRVELRYLGEPVEIRPSPGRVMARFEVGEQ